MHEPVVALEAAFGRLVGDARVLGVCSGTAGYLAALLAIGAGRGSEVVISAYNWPQLLAVPRTLGVDVVLADTDLSGRMTSEAVRQALGPRTIAVVVCHLFGNPAEIREIRSLADAHGLIVIEDCSQALLSRYAGIPVGCWGDVGFASIGEGKLLSGLEGGLVWTHDRSIARGLWAATQHPSRTSDAGMRRECLVSSLSLRMHPSAAEMALGELETLPARASRAAAAQERLMHELTDTPLLHLPEVFPNAAPCWTWLPLRTEFEPPTDMLSVLSDFVPAYLLSEADKFPNAALSAKTTHFIETGRRWENVSAEDTRRLAATIRTSAARAAGAIS